MRIYLILIFFSSLLVASCGNESAGAGESAAVNVAANASGQLTTIQWLDSAKNYGKINEGQKLALSFRFKNTGNKPLVIQSVLPTCGCTVADYPKQPIAPGDEGEITGEFDSNGREGHQRKHLTVRSNTAGGSTDITFEVNVTGRRNAQASNQTN